MDLLVVGGGGREHAIIKKLKENPVVETIYALPGNGGIAADAVCVPEIGATEIGAIVDFAVSHAVGFAVVAPDDPLALGCVDALHAAGIPCFGPDARAARIESSKVFAKDLMKKYHIPTAQYEVFDTSAAALAYLKTASFPIVIKADGLALGKGVLISRSYEEAEDAVRTMMEDRAFGDSGSRVVIEEFLTGPEVSVLSFTDGRTLVPMVSSMDHKRAGDGDTGPNTGGMGTVAPNPCYTEDIARVCMDTIFLPTLAAMRAESCPFKGCLYFGLMLTPDGPKVIEYNARFGDPETEVLMPRLKSDLVEVMLACAEQRLDEIELEWRDEWAVSVVLTSAGYPGSYEKGKVITGIDDAAAMENVTVYHAGTAMNEDGEVVTSGGRVLDVTALGETFEAARDLAYAACEKIDFEGKTLRRDIGLRALRGRDAWDA